MPVPIDYNQAVKELSERMKAFYDRAIIDVNKEWKKNYIKGSKFANKIELLANETQQEIDGQFIERFCHKATMSLMLKFIFYRFAEDKNILDSYYKQEAIIGWQDKKDVSKIIKESFVKAQNKFKGLYVPTPYDEFLPANETLKVYLVDALSDRPMSGVYKNKGGINFSTLDPRVVSAFYEKLFDRKKRKELGMFFTPPVIADYLVEKAFEGQNITKDFLVLEPACGSGQILLATYDRLKKVFLEKGFFSNEHEAHKYILTHNLWGVDVEPFSVLLSRINLTLQDLDHAPEFINIIHGDSLLETNFDVPQTSLLKEIGNIKKQKLKKDKFITHGGKEIEYWHNGDGKIYSEKPIEQGELFELAEIMKTGIFSEIEHRTIKDMPEKFDAVIANPPYGAKLKNEEIENKFFITSENIPCCNSYNSEAVFIEKGLSLLKDNGQLCFIVPNGIARGNSFAKIRYLILNSFLLKCIVDEGNPFEEVTLEMITIFIKKCKSEESFVEMFSRRGDLLKKISDVPQSTLKFFNRFIIYYDSIFDKLLKIGEVNAITTSGNMVIGTRFLNKARRNNTDIPVITGRSTDRYSIREGKLEYVDITHLKKLKRHYSFLREELLVQTLHINEFRVVLKPLNYTIGESSVLLYFNSILYSPFYIMAILNSGLFRFITKRYIFNNSNLTFDLTSPATRLCPIVKTDAKRQKTFIELADKMVNLNKALNKIKINFNCVVFERTKEKFFLRKIAGVEFVLGKNSNARLNENDKIVLKKINNKIVAVFINNENRREILRIVFKGSFDSEDIFWIENYLNGLEHKHWNGNNSTSWQELILSIKIPWPKKEIRKKIIVEYKNMVLEKSNLEKEIAETDKKIDEMVYGLYKITKKERKIIEDSI